MRPWQESRMNFAAVSRDYWSGREHMRLTRRYSHSWGCRAYLERLERNQAVMHPELLFAAVQHRPFVPIRLHVSDGATYDVRHPDSILVTRHSVILAMPGDANVLPERAVTIAPVHVTRLEELANTPPTGSGA